ncbi:hypothetical protein F5884DRAFT_749981 [Xylogone sp. PMI_703]|nr:hypothetical protein F5884DRAFT_749981 [Xylogone sp. PMI_703]
MCHSYIKFYTVCRHMNSYTKKCMKHNGDQKGSTSFINNLLRCNPKLDSLKFDQLCPDCSSHWNFYLISDTQAAELIREFRFLKNWQGSVSVHPNMPVCVADDENTPNPADAAQRAAARELGKRLPGPLTARKNSDSHGGGRLSNYRKRLTNFFQNDNDRPILSPRRRTHRARDTENGSKSATYWPTTAHFAPPEISQTQRQHRQPSPSRQPSQHRRPGQHRQSSQHRHRMDTGVPPASAPVQKDDHGIRTRYTLRLYEQARPPDTAKPLPPVPLSVPKKSAHLSPSQHHDARHDHPESSRRTRRRPGSREAARRRYEEVNLDDYFTPESFTHL